MVQYLTIKGKKHPVRISYFALKMLKAEAGVSLENIAKQDDFSAYETLLFYSLMQGAKVTEQEFTIKREDIEMIMDEVFFDFIKLIPIFFPSAKKEDDAGASGKKKSPSATKS